MALFTKLLQKFTNKEKLTQGSLDSDSDSNKRNFNEITVSLLLNGLMFMFFFIYISHGDKYIPNDNSFKVVLKVISSTFLVLSFISIVVDVLEYFHQ